jgi:hypothetical protein
MPDRDVKTLRFENPQEAHLEGRQNRESKIDTNPVPPSSSK